MKKMTKSNVGKIKLAQEETESPGLAVQSGLKVGASFAPASFVASPVSFKSSFVG